MHFGALKQTHDTAEKLTDPDLRDYTADPCLSIRWTDRSGWRGDLPQKLAPEASSWASAAAQGQYWVENAALFAYVLIGPLNVGL